MSEVAVVDHTISKGTHQNRMVPSLRRLAALREGLRQRGNILPDL